MIKKGLIIIGVIIALAVWIAAPATAAPKYKWRAQLLTPLTSYMGTVYWGTWVKLVKERTNGQVEIKLFPPGAIAKGTQIYGAVQNGAVEVGCSYGAYHSTEIPAAYAEYSIPMGFKDMNAVYDFYYQYKNGEVLKLLDGLYRKKGTTLLSVAAFTVGFMTKFPINTIADLKGKKLRASGSYAALLKNLGAAPVLLPSPEQYMALQRGTIDGTLNPLYMAQTYKLKEVIKYIMVPPVGFGLGDTYVNLDAWNKLPTNLQEIVRQAAVDAALKYYKVEYDKLESHDIKEAEKVGVKVLKLSPAELKAIRKAAEPLWAQ
ncbi:MAG: TRAP transporter substrate-binding protein DctP, partial [Proteobacteria bacterium]|nr:TRAP transporter substrate-binding protein DctP [Pseudomonadota bacterium]